MSTPAHRPANIYSPLYFLASLGAGGLAVTFFMYLMFWVPHPNQPVPVFEDILKAFQTGPAWLQTAIVVAWVGIAVMVFLNVKMLLWNLKQVGIYKTTDAWKALSNSNGETQIMAMPLALAMTVNAGFIVGLVYVPGLWVVVEYLFPLALIAFLAIGYLAFRQLGTFIGRLAERGGFNCEANNSFAQMMPAFALAMVGVGLSAPAALSTVKVVAGISLVASTFFLVASVVITVIALILGLRSMMENGANAETAPTLMVVIPIMTVLGILIVRQSHGLHVHFGSHGSAGDMLITLSRMISLQVLIALFGLLVLKRVGYAKRFLTGSENSAGAYGLVCPGVALNVMSMFWINKGLVGAGIIAKFGTAYFVLSIIPIALQIAMVALVFHLNRRHFKGTASGNAVPAE
ncbi:MAG: TsoY family (seleno)protein [Halocynthiibacter sp.]